VILLQLTAGNGNAGKVSWCLARGSLQLAKGTASTLYNTSAGEFPLSDDQMRWNKES